MKNRIKIFLLVAFCASFVFAATSCSEKQQALRDLESLAEEVKENGNEYGVSEWMDVFDQYRTISETIDKHRMDYTQKQRGRISKARSTIKSAAWNYLTDTIENLPPYIKDPVINLYNKVFGQEEREEY